MSLSGKLPGRGLRYLPARKDQYGRVATQGQSKGLRTFHTKIDATVFDAGNGCLRDATQSGQLDLAETLELTDNADGLAGRNIDAFFGRAEIAHSGSPVVVRGYANDLHKQGVSNDPVNHSPLLVEPGRAMAFPPARKRLVVKASDGAKSGWARQRGDVLPLFVALEDIQWDTARKLLVDVPMLLDCPHH